MKGLIPTEFKQDLKFENTEEMRGVQEVIKNFSLGKTSETLTT